MKENRDLKKNYLSHLKCKPLRKVYLIIPLLVGIVLVCWKIGWTINSKRNFPTFALVYPVKSIAISVDGRFLAAGEGHISAQVKIWNIKTGQLLHKIQTGHNAAVWSIAFSPNGKTLVTAGRDDGRLFLWNVQTGKKSGQLASTLSITNSLAFSSDGKTLISAGRDKGAKIEVWDFIEKKLRSSMKDDDGNAAFAALMPENKTLLTIGIEGTQFREITTLKLLSQLQIWGDERREYLKFALSPDGSKIAVGVRNAPGQSEQIEVWDLGTKKILYSLAEDKGVKDAPWQAALGALAFSPDNKILVSSSAYQGIKVRSAQTGRLLEQRPDIFATSIAFLPNSRSFVIGNGRKIHLWHMEKPE